MRVAVRMALAMVMFVGLAGCTSPGAVSPDTYPPPAEAIDTDDAGGREFRVEQGRRSE